MALVGPGAMTEYTGGPSRGRSRGFVSVNEPAQGFFVTGSSIAAMAGVYGRVKPASVWSEHTILLAYRNDDKPNWVMALVEQQAPAPKRKPKPPRRRVMGAWESESEESDEGDGRHEWLFIDSDCRDRFRHDGDTIIPGAGVSWKHLHRGRGQPAKKPEARYTGSGSDSSHNSSDYEDAMSTCTPPETEADLLCWDLQEQAPDDEDELPWQVIAILDRQTMRDMRYTQSCYEKKIATALSGESLPRPALFDIAGLSTPGVWLYKVVSPRGIEVRRRPDAEAAVVGFRDDGEYVQGLERRAAWLRLSPDRTRDVTGVAANGEREASWVFMGEGEASTRRIVAVAEEDLPCLRAQLREQPEADIFDRPFEPRLEGPSAADEREQTAEEQENEEAPVEGGDFVAALLPPPPEEYALGSAVVLEGLSVQSYNGQEATIVTSLENGRQGVRLASGELIATKVHNLRPALLGEDGALARHARTLGLSLGALGLTETASGEVVPAEGSEEHAALANAPDIIGAALRAMHRDSDCDAGSARSQAQAAHDALSAAVAEKAADAPPIERKVPAVAPHELVERGALGARAAEAAVLAASSDSLEAVKQGVDLLREVLIDEQARLRRAGGAEGMDALRLRLTLVRALLRGQREAEAAEEAAVARLYHPASGPAMLWRGRCCMRSGEREAGLAELQLAASADGTAGPDCAWAAGEARRRVRAAREAKRCEVAAQDAYGRGQFEEAASLYGDAISKADVLNGDDRWSRAERLANRAACLRRARRFKEAIDGLDVALLLFPGYKRAHFRRGVCFLEWGRPQDAVTALEMLLRLDRSWPNMLEWLVRAHALQRRQESGRGGYRHPAWGLPRAGPAFAETGKWAEAPEEKDIANEKDHYTVLGVPTDATEKQLKRAYRVMSLKFHPDKEGGSTRAFQRVASAFQTLSDPEKRVLYDEGADLKIGKDNDSDSDDERKQQSLREEVERKYFPERYKFWPFGDPFVQKRKRQERVRQRAGRPAFHEGDI